MGNGKRHIVRNILFVVLGLILVFIISLCLSFDFVGGVKDEDCSHEYVMRGVFADKDPRVVDIAMLGAHDAFTSDIEFKSVVNKNESGIITNSIVNFLAKGFVKRMSKAQPANAMQLLKSGVRYLDVRVTLVDGEYYTAHGLVSNTLEYYLKDVVEFLGTHPGEVVIFDIQHFQMPNESDTNTEFANLMNFMAGVKNSQGKSIFDYVHYDLEMGQIPLSELRYSTVTQKRTSGGAVVLAKYSGDVRVYSRDNQTIEGAPDSTKVIRSLWHETNSYNELVKGISNEVEFVKNNNINDVFVVNQAQLTGFVGGFRLVKSLFMWSITDMAANSNAKLVQNKEEFMYNIEYLKIFMVDNATSTKGNFVKLVNAYILEANRNLPGYVLDGTYKSDSLLSSYVSYTFFGNQVRIDTYAVGVLATTSKGTYNIDTGKITFELIDYADGVTSTRVYTESFEQNGDTIKIGAITLKKS